MVDFDIDEAVTGMVEKGEIDLKQVQIQGRVDVNDNWLDELGLSEGDKVHLVFEGDSISIMKASLDNVTNGEQSDSKSVE
jgi:hypothetical protein